MKYLFRFYVYFSLLLIISLLCIKTPFAHEMEVYEYNAFQSTIEDMPMAQDTNKWVHLEYVDPSYIPYYRIIGNDPGLIQEWVTAGEPLQLMINSTNVHGDIPVLEWLLLTGIYDGYQLPMYLISDYAGIVNYNDVAWELHGYTYTFSSSDLTTIAYLSMSDLDFKSGDILFYAYQYLNQSGVMISDNTVYVIVY
ncbi:MAG: hypothetical protein AB7T22_14400 [Calditrichaceae bacterium]